MLERIETKESNNNTYNKFEGRVSVPKKQNKQKPKVVQYATITSIEMFG